MDDITFVDRHIANKLREFRKNTPHTMSSFATLVGVSQQQYRNYEVGVTRLTCNRLYSISLLLDVQVASFFEGLPRASESQSPAPRKPKSPSRLKIEQLARQPIGTKVRFPYGSFTSPQAVKRLLDLTGRRGWAEVRLSTTGTTVKKVAEP